MFLIRDYPTTVAIDFLARSESLPPGHTVHDDENPEHALNFRVFRLIRGTVTGHADHLLSPVIYLEG